MVAAVLPSDWAEKHKSFLAPIPRSPPQNTRYLSRNPTRSRLSTDAPPPQRQLSMITRFHPRTQSSILSTSSFVSSIQSTRKFLDFIHVLLPTQQQVDKMQRHSPLPWRTTVRWWHLGGLSAAQRLHHHDRLQEGCPANQRHHHLPSIPRTAH